MTKQETKRTTPKKFVDQATPILTSSSDEEQPATQQQGQQFRFNHEAVTQRLKTILAEQAYESIVLTQALEEALLSGQQLGDMLEKATARINELESQTTKGKS